MELGITHQSAVDAWECDQMEHLSVRLYGARFTEAEAHAFAALGMAARPAIAETMRFSAEVRRGAAVRIETRQDGPLHLVHTLFDGERDAPSATLDAHYGESEASGPADQADGWLSTGRAVLGPRDLDGHGPTREATLRLLNHAGIHLGVDRHRQRGPDGGLVTGSATVGCRMSRPGLGRRDALVLVESRVGRRGRTSVTLRHRVLDAISRATLIEADVTVVYFDMVSRRPVPLPAGLREPAQGASTA